MYFLPTSFPPKIPPIPLILLADLTIYFSKKKNHIFPVWLNSFLICFYLQAGRGQSEFKEKIWIPGQAGNDNSESRFNNIEPGQALVPKFSAFSSFARFFLEHLGHAFKSRVVFQGLASGFLDQPALLKLFILVQGQGLGHFH
jgi:hypothetical protein